MTDEHSHGPPGAKTDPPGPAASAAVDQYQKILAEAESFAELFMNSSYPLLAKHTSGSLRASIAVEVACTMHLTDALRDHTAAIREQTELLRRDTARNTGDPAEG